jgi:hypothetical protein
MPIEFAATVTLASAAFSFTSIIEELYRRLIGKFAPRDPFLGSAENVVANTCGSLPFQPSRFDFPV